MKDSKLWDNISLNLNNGQPYDELLSEQYVRVHLDLVNRWCKNINSLQILKTDLFAEGVCPARSFLWDILKNKTELTGIDISPHITDRARNNLTRYENSSRVSFVACDVRKLPFINNHYDLVISDSTLDHFNTEEEIDTALGELVRVIKPGGTLIITLDNKGNITDPLFEIWKSLRLGSFYTGKTYNIKQFLGALEKLDVEISDYTAILHNPRFFTKLIIGACRKFTGKRMDNRLRKWLLSIDKQENKNTRYLTAQFIAVKAVKR